MDVPHYPDVPKWPRLRRLTPIVARVGQDTLFVSHLHLAMVDSTFPQTG